MPRGLCAMPERFRAPGRVNLIGGQVDYHEGWVVSMAIDRDVVVNARPRADGRIVAQCGDWLAWVPFASGYAYGMRFAPREHVGSLPALDDRSRDDLAQLLTDALGRLDRATHGASRVAVAHLAGRRGRHERIAVDLAVRVVDGRAHLAPAILEHQHVLDLVAREQRPGAFGPEVDDLAHLGAGQTGQRLAVLG